MTTISCELTKRYDGCCCMVWRVDNEVYGAIFLDWNQKIRNTVKHTDKLDRQELMI